MSFNVLNPKRIKEDIYSFDEVTKFRLINSFFVAIGFSALGPIITILQGTLMIHYLIGVFSIANMLAVKSNDYIIKTFSTNQIYKISVVLHIVYTIGAFIYFYNPYIMIYLDSVIGIIETTFLSAYSIKLTNYISEKHPEDISRFQIVRNSIWADGALIGLGLVSLVLYVSASAFAVSNALIMFIIINSIFGIWLVKNFYFFEKVEIK